MKKDIKKKVLRRLRITEGQVRGLQKMVENETYCIDVITQVSAVRKALSSIEDLMLENHLSGHVTHQMQHGEKKKAINEIIKIYKLTKKK